MDGVEFPFTSCLPLRLAFDAATTVCPWVKATNQHATFSQDIYNEYVDKVAEKCGRMTDEEVAKVKAEHSRGIVGAARVRKVVFDC
jgi:hypothetical protein